MITPDYTGIELRLKQNAGKTYVFDPLRKKWLILTPEEHVRQYTIHYLQHILKYPAALISVEKKIMVGNMPKRFDIVVYSRAHKPWMLIECKAPEVMLSENVLRQLLQYQQTIQCSYWVLTNGHQMYCADACDIKNISWLSSLPVYN